MGGRRGYSVEELEVAFGRLWKKLVGREGSPKGNEEARVDREADIAEGVGGDNGFGSEDNGRYWS